MTGKELIIYILQNNLEDEPVFKDGKLLGFMTVKEAAIKFEVGENAILAWIGLGWLPYIPIGNGLYIPANIDKPTPNS
jgi:hypothetical protein